MRFRDRADAGRRLAALLLSYRGHDTRVFGLNEGGVRVAYEVARALERPLEVWVSRVVEVQALRGSRLGAVAEGQGFCLDTEGGRFVDAPASEMRRWVDAQAGEVALEAHRLRGGHPRLEPGAGLAVLVVEGIAVGDLQVYAALRGLRRQSARQLVLAAPVAAAEELERLRPEADEVVCLHPVWALLSVAHAYEGFQGVPDVEVRQLLERAREPTPGRGPLGVDLTGEWL